MKTRLLAAAFVAVLAGCGGTSAPAIGSGLVQPVALAVFRGVTVKSGLNPSDPVYPYRPYTAIANSGGNDLTLLDGVDGTVVQSSIPIYGAVNAVPGRPIHLVAGDLGDRKPDLLAVVVAGDLPWLGGSSLEVIRTWAPEGGVAQSCATTAPDSCRPVRVELGADILDVKALPFDPAGAGSVQLVAALAGERVAVVTFHRSTAGDGTAIDVGGAQVVTSAPLGFQPVDLAVLPADPARGTPTRLFAASEETLPDGTLGVAEISLAGTPAFVPPGLNALAPTRLVAAAHLAEADLLRDLSSSVASALDATAFVNAATSVARPVEDRVYAMLLESGCGLTAPIGCGLVALDPATHQLAIDPTPVGSMHADYRAPIHTPFPLAFGVIGPPALPPSAAEPQYAGTYMKIAANAGWRQATGAGALAGFDGGVWFMDLSRWDVAPQAPIRSNVTATVTSGRPAHLSGTQWLVLNGVASHLNTPALAAAVSLTPGYTPTDQWVVAREGTLPQLSGLRAEVGNESGPWLALQQTSTYVDPITSTPKTEVEAAVRLWDPTLGVRIGDTVVIDPVGLGTCGEFEATITEVAPPDAIRPGGFVRLAPRVPPADSLPITAATQAMWNRCVAEMAQFPTSSQVVQPPFYTATFRAAGYVLNRGSGTAVVHVGRPQVGVPFSAAWQAEAPLAAACPLPPSAPWTSQPAAPPACDAACRDGCMDLQRVRLARRVSYVNEAPANATGPALGFTLALEVPSLPVPRDLTLVMSTNDGRQVFGVGPTVGSPVNPRQVLPFDRSPWNPAAGARFLIPYTGGVVVDTTPTIPGGSVYTVQ